MEDFGWTLRNAIANHSSIKDEAKKRHTIVTNLDGQYRIEYRARESWSDPGICTITYSYSGYVKRWYGWKRIFYANTSSWGALSVSFDSDPVYKWTRRNRPYLDQMLTLIEG